METNELHSAAACIVAGKHRAYPSGHATGLAMAVVDQATTLDDARHAIASLADHPDARVRDAASVATAKLASLYAARQRRREREADPIQAVEDDLDRLQDRFEAGENVSGEPGFNPDWLD